MFRRISKELKYGPFGKRINLEKGKCLESLEINIKNQD